MRRVILVVYSDNVATYLKGKGVYILNAHEIKKVHKIKESQEEKTKRLGKEGKEVAAKILEEQIAKAINYLKVEENREKVVQAGIAIAQVVIQIATKKKK